MKILLCGVDNTLEFYRDDPSVTETLSIVDPATGEELATPVVTNDATDENIVAAIAKGDSSFDVAGAVSKGVDYLVQHDPVSLGPSQRISTIGVGAGAGEQVNIKYPFMYAMAAGCQLKGIRSSATYSPAATYAGKPLWAIWTDSDGTRNRENYLCLKYELKCPISSDDVRDRWSRSLSALPQWQQIAQVGWQPQIDEAWNELRNEFYTNGKILDWIVSADLLKPVTFALIEKILIGLGHDPGRSGESLMDSQNRIGQKVSQLLVKAYGLPHQEDDTDSNKNTGRTYKRALRPNIWRND